MLLENAAARALLPEKISTEPLTEVLSRIDRFCLELQDLVRGRGGDKSLIHRHKASHAIFKKSIRSTAPRLEFLDTVQYLSPEECGPEPDLDPTEVGQSAASLVSGSEFSVNDDEVVEIPKHYTLYDVRRIIKR